MWGIHPDQSRNRLIFTGNGEKGVGLPLSDWGYEFSDKMPEEIREAIHKSRGDGSNSLEDEEYRKRLQDKFGSRWLTTQLVQARSEDRNTRAATATNETADTVERERTGRPRVKRKRPRRIQVIRLRATEGGNGQGWKPTEQRPQQCDAAIAILNAGGMNDGV
jgi:hypothetical protein